MDPNAPRPDDAGRPEEAVVPDPHRGEALPDPQSGTRPGTDAGVVRPEQDEPGGPLVGLISAASAEVTEEATPDGDPDAEAVLARMGVEDEGIESGQLLGFLAATLIAVGVLAVVLIFFIYAPFRDDTRSRVDNVSLYPELEQTRVNGRAKLGQATRSGDTYTVPIGRAMGLVAAEYGAAADTTAAARLSRAQFNTTSVNRTAGRAVQAPVAQGGAVTTAEGSASGAEAETSLPAGAYNPAEPPSGPVPRTLADGQEQAATPGR